MYLEKMINKESDVKPTKPMGRLPLILKSFEINSFICYSVSC